ncbi:HAD family phosphatase [Chitinophaga horti]|uniref:HAD family phosphatase n=1 Tax=Chitinophaga horti TaxID=2920382 RepID=A0ABY6J6U7_9BACT|nr:HAD family phosphatase [Chitinophaga horti]UYQ94019.1 HAD family phosphatase [Chitinophaga horti]
MEHKTYHTIIFDLGAVLVDWNPRYLYKKIFTDEKEMEHFLANVCTSDWNEEQDGGRRLQEATDLLVAQHPTFETQIRAFYGRWPEMLNGALEGTVEIFRQLNESGKYKIYALTNWSDETFPIAMEIYPFFKWFDGILVSGTEKMRKPHAAFYQLLLDRFSIDAKHAIFIDDNLRNVKAAEDFGIESIHFTSPEALETVLKEKQIL